MLGGRGGGVVFIAFGLLTLAFGPEKEQEANLQALGLDVAGAAIPCATGLGIIRRVGSAASRATDFALHPRVLEQLSDPRLKHLAGKLAPEDLNRLLNDPGGTRFLNARSGNISVVQTVEGVNLRITVAADELKIISVGPISPSQVRNRLRDGDYIQLP